VVGGMFTTVLAILFVMPLLIRALHTKGDPEAETEIEATL
jgi:hypothetical protein